MKVRGRRECKDCGREWSYYRTGSVACPNCGSLRSVGLDDRTRHTAAPVAFDLSTHRNAVEDAAGSDLADVVPDVKSTVRAYVSRRGFVDAGDLVELDDEFLAAQELLQAADVYGRLRDPTDDERLYVLGLLRGADAGERPPPDRVPASMREARGLGVAEAVLAYRREAATWLDDHSDPAARTTLGSIAERAKRVRALQGDVDPGEAETLVTATREVWAALHGDEAALARARDRLERV
jgi:uncharacterized Zn finger protein (UPF0148 family)